MKRSNQPRPIYFGPPDRSLFGWLDVPSSKEASCAVVMAGSVGMEEFGADPALTHLQGECRSRGIASLKFHYDGTADSAGRWDDPDRWDAWLLSIRHAVEFLQTAGIQRVVLLGVHLGALLTAKSARELGVDGVVFWEPILSGRAFLRQQQLLLSTIHGAPAERSDGGVEGPLFYYGPDLAKSIRAAKIFPADVPSTARTLVLSRSGDMPPELTMAEWNADISQAQSDASDLGEYPNPYRLPYEDAEFIVDWISRNIAGPLASVDCAGRGESQFCPSPTSLPVVERPVWIGDVPLFGVVCEPIDWAGGTTAIFLTSGVWTHIGSGHMWCRFAREWAQVGVRSVRVDISGIGPSGMRLGQPRQRSLTTHIIDDCEQIAKYFGNPSGSDLVFVGASTGGYNCLEVALGMNPKAVLVANPEPGPKIDLVSAELGSVEGHKGYRPFPRPLLRLAHNRKRSALWIWRAISQVIVNWAPERSIGVSLRRNVRVFAFFGTTDYASVRGHLYWTMVWRRYLRKGRLRLHVSEGIDHGFFTSWQRDRLLEVFTRWIEEVASEDVS